MSFLTLILLIHINSGLVLSYGLEEMDYLFAEPDYDIKEIPEKFRQLCGYRYRPYIRTVEYKAKCFSKGLSNGRPTDVRNITEVYKPSESLRPKSRVLHGTVAAKHESPWTVQLAYIDHFHGYFRSYMYSCTGVLITPRHILTAAHCHKESGQLALFVGNNKAFDDRYYIGEKYSFLRHPNYKTNDPNSPITKYDIGIIVLDKPIEPVVVWTNTLDSVVTTICLPKANILIGHFEYRSATFFGWGDIGDGPTSPQELRRADVKRRTIAPP